MNNLKNKLAMFGAALLLVPALASCSDDPASNTPGAGGSDTSGSTATTSAATTSASTTSASTTSGTGGSSSTTSGSGGSGGSGTFAFATDDYSAYTQIDRHAAPEAGTAGIAGPAGLGLKDPNAITIRDAYNKSNPAEDASGKWVPEIQKSVEAFHSVLDDDLLALQLVPATTAESLAQAGPVVVPDTIKYDPSKPSGYPNGRKLEDPVVDLTLAAVLLKLDAKQPITLFADLPLNPPANDVPFQASFPFLAPPH